MVLPKHQQVVHNYSAKRKNNTPRFNLTALAKLVLIRAHNVEADFQLPEPLVHYCIVECAHALRQEKLVIQYVQIIQYIQNQLTLLKEWMTKSTSSYLQIQEHIFWPSWRDGAIFPF